MTSDPDGLSFFTEGRPDEAPVSLTGSVFGVVPDGRLDRMLNMAGADEIGTPCLPEDEPVGPAPPRPRRPLAEPVQPLALHPALTYGTHEWRLEFVLNGPGAELARSAKERDE